MPGGGSLLRPPADQSDPVARGSSTVSASSDS
jgi:hypothetical protein